MGSPAMKSIEQKDLVELINLLNKAQSPKVTFSKNLDEMQKEATDQTYLNIHMALNLLDAVNRGYK